VPSILKYIGVACGTFAHNRFYLYCVFIGKMLTMIKVEDPVFGNAISEDFNNVSEYLRTQRNSQILKLSGFIAHMLV